MEEEKAPYSWIAHYHVHIPEVHPDPPPSGARAEDRDVHLCTFIGSYGISPDDKTFVQLPVGLSEGTGHALVYSLKEPSKDDSDDDYYDERLDAHLYTLAYSPEHASLVLRSGTTAALFCASTPVPHVPALLSNNNYVQVDSGNPTCYKSENDGRLYVNPNFIVSDTALPLEAESMLSSDADPGCLKPGTMLTVHPSISWETFKRNPPQTWMDIETYDDSALLAREFDM